MKSFFKNLLYIIIVLVVAFGVVKGIEYHNKQLVISDDSYKVNTERNSKYNGVYTLTKLDKNGNNTWNGLVMYVENDSILSAELVEFESKEDIIKNQLNGKTDATNDDILEATTLKPKIKLMNAKETGFLISDYIQNDYGIIVATGQMLLKAGFDFNKEYTDIKSCNAVAGYDEECNEVWLSKLLSNEKSEYHEGYKLIKYNNYYDFEECPILREDSIDILNKKFNANIKDWVETEKDNYY